ncbi:MAG: aldehyde dehydrogenase family protein, partial [Pseudomonadales bacterium]
MHDTVQQLTEQFKITDQAREFLTSEQRMYINGHFTEGESRAHSVIVEPCTGEQLTVVPSASENDVDSAVQAARAAFENSQWSRMKPMERERLLHRIADLLEERAQTVAEIESLDAGKAITGCRAADVAGSINLLRYMAGWASKIEGSIRRVSAPGEQFACTMREPIGVVGAIVPWNWPLSMAIWKLAAPLAAGCTVVLKPAEITPLSMLYFAQLCAEAGLPDGVINIVTGKGSTIGQHLVSRPGIDKVSFTGSTPVGKQVGQAAVENMTHATLELGGKSPMVVFEDADIDAVVQATQQSVFFNAGQVCSAGSRMYVHKEIYSQVVESVAARASRMKQGFTLDPETEMGPAISAQQRDSVYGYIAYGKEEGARVACGGDDVNGPGYYVQPTVFADCNNDMRI